MTALVPIETTSRYRPVATIGRGGMAEAVLTLLDAGRGVAKVVVLKRIWPDLGTDPDFVAMFQDEAQLAIRLNHPNVVQTLEVVQDAQQLAIAMEYLHGQPLSAVLNHHLSGPYHLSLALRLRIFVDVLAGLHYAHELTDYRGVPLCVVHRDVNPHNVFVTYGGVVKLMDFGVAKTVAAAYQTRPGAIKGKLAYLAPESLRSDAVDRRADIFATGIMLWELLAGRRLWQGMTEAQIVHHLAAGTPIPALPPDVIRPPVLDAICGRALAMNPSERYDTAADLENELQRVLAGSADSHARTLGRVISHAFAGARAEREALIARALEAVGQSVPVSGSAAASRVMRASPSAPELERPREATWARDVDAFLVTADQLLDVTSVDPAVVPRGEPPPPPKPARRGAFARGVIAGGVLTAAVLALVMTELRRPAAPPIAPAATMSASPSEARAPLAEPLPPLPPSLTAGIIRETAEATAVAEGPGPARRQGRWRVRHDAASVRAGNKPTADAPFDPPKTDRLRAASLRSIDESDPFK